MAVARSGYGWVRVFLLAFVLFAYFMPRWADWNIDSRFDLSRALVDHRTLSLGRSNWNTWDKAVYKGKFYSDKAPGTAVLGAVVYAGFAAVRGAPLLGDAIHDLENNRAWNVAIALGRSGTQKDPPAKGRRLGGCRRAGISGSVQYIPWGNRLVPPIRDWALSKYISTIGGVDLIAALFAGFFFWFLGFFAISRRLRWLLTGLYVVGTVALPYSTVFYSHQISAAFLFAGFGLLYLRSKRRLRAWAAPAAGFLLGFALFTEYTIALLLLPIGLYALWKLRRMPGDIVAVAVAAAIPVAGLLAYNAAAFSGPLDTGYSHDFCWSAAQAAGYAGFTYPKLKPLFDLTFGTFRGLFFTSPFLLLAFPGAVVMWRRGYKAEALVCVAGSVLFILALSAYWGWNGGRVDGPRYLVPAVPFLAFPALFFIQRFRRQVWAWILVGVLGAWSLVATWLSFLGGALFPISWLRDPLFQYSVPALVGNQIAPNAGFFLGLRGWESLLPLVGLLVLISLPWGRLTGRPYVAIRP
ncbi:MAG: hypothetical protein ACRDFS_13580 [Chloroflexota bacterium]